MSRVRSQRLTSGTRAAPISFVTVGLALSAIAWGLLQPLRVSLVVFALLAIVCVIVIARLTLLHVGVVLIALFCLTASWDQAAVAGINFRQLFLILGGLLLATGLDLRRLPPVPWWLHAYGLSAIVVTCLQTLLLSNDSYLTERYATSAAGQSLGIRTSTLESLLSLLFNNYGVPLVLVVACMYLPGALRWLIGAYVVGAAMSCGAAILSYYGHPGISDFFGGFQAPAGERASGFTSHPLRLATSGVMAMALASWMALQPHRGLKWSGWVSVPVLIMGLYVSGSRGGIVAGFLLLVLCMFMLPDVRRRIHWVLSGSSATLLGVFLLFPSVVFGLIGSTRITGGVTSTVSDTGRSELLAQGMQDFRASPIIGIGVRYLAEAHTLYVGVLAAGGIIFAVGYFLFNVGSIRTSVQAVEVDRSLGGALLATLIASLLYWTVADLIQTKTVATIYGFLIALWWQGQNDTAAPPSGQGVTGRPEPMAHADGGGTSLGVRPE